MAKAKLKTTILEAEAQTANEIETLKSKADQSAVRRVAEEINRCVDKLDTVITVRFVLQKLWALSVARFDQFNKSREGFEYEKLFGQYDLFSMKQSGGKQIITNYIRMDKDAPSTNRVIPYDFVELIDISERKPIHLEIHFLSSTDVHLYDHEGTCGYNFHISELVENTELLQMLHDKLHPFHELVEEMLS